ncbi:CMGC/MAPK protein kinase [Fomitiporia mediterranea MF3/22]|uniref:CMGC/MAPK protein kinase n=1 Tax=Fomitiporia mediterranea (strain MF3/22) TaxID=694068 RepID=UPI0004408D16|nr:CMGC/MAPK protein kinase [Fomitiporia mediterranea MF3/22]EJD04172.1 CMGC/MAPK protein kinase [Fomitiporia mediterranea MF3/22]
MSNDGHLWLGPLSGFQYSSYSLGDADAIPAQLNSLCVLSFLLALARTSCSKRRLETDMISRGTKSKRPLPTFEVGSDYRILHVLGEGAYGTVVAALHEPSGTHVAIKKILPFDHTLFCLRTLRELKLLKFFSQTAVNDNIISILDIIKPPSLDDFKEVYFVQELMQADLHQIIRTQHLTDDHCEYFIYQILRAIKSMHSADIVHRDLKPANILVNQNCDLKVCDFGLARNAHTGTPAGESGLMTEYVATRWYRAPEIMLSFKMYTKAIDLWAVGCILAEMMMGKPLFPGRDYGHQLDLILDVIGTPTLEEYAGITSRRSRDYIRALPIRRRKPLISLIPSATPSTIDFLSNTLTFDPKKRMTIEEALRHPYVAAYYDLNDEPECFPMDPEYFHFDTQKEMLGKAQLKELLYEEIQSFTPTLGQ